MADYVQLFLTGLLSGTTVCGMGCFSYLGPYLIGSGHGFRDGAALTMHYLTGKILLYMILGGIAGHAGKLLTPPENTGLVTGTTFILIGLLLPLWNRSRCGQQTRRQMHRGSLFTLGIMTSAVPCPSLVALLGMAAASGSMAGGIVNTGCFGIGLLLSPMIVCGGFLSKLAHGLKLEASFLQTVFQGFAMIMFITLGIQKILEH